MIAGEFGVRFKNFTQAVKLKFGPVEENDFLSQAHGDLHGHLHSGNYEITLVNLDHTSMRWSVQRQ